MKAIEVTELYKSYEDTEALKNMSFSVDESELFGLIGPDGAGKTSQLRILATLLIQDSGRAIVNGLDTTKDYKEIRRIIGYMPQRFSLYQDLSIIENLNFFATVFNTTVEENYDLIKDIYIQIERFKDRKAGKLSGGMKQKLGLCCALIHKPEILILDEPTTGVDAVSRKEFWEMLSSLKKKGITIIVSTPYMDEAELCDRVALIQKGSILTIDKPAKLPLHFENKLFEIKSSNNYQIQKVLRSEFGENSSYLFGHSIHFSCTKKNVEKDHIIKFLNKNELIFDSVNEIIPQTEDCFISLMNKN